MSGTPLVQAITARPRAAAIALLALTLGVTLVVLPWSDETVSDLGVRVSYAAQVLDGEIPYRDFFFEYPPLAAPAIALPGVLGTGEEAYRLGIAATTLLATSVTLLLAGSLARRTGGSALAAMGAVALSPLLVGAVVPSITTRSPSR